MEIKEQYQLEISQLRLWLPVGCTAEERKAPQPIDIDLRIAFAEEPLGCLRDQLEDVVCYHTLVEHLSASLAHCSFHLIEHLAAKIFEIIAQNITGAWIEIAVTKPHHPVPNVQKGITFRYRKKS